MPSSECHSNYVSFSSFIRIWRGIAQLMCCIDCQVLVLLISDFYASVFSYQAVFVLCTLSNNTV